MNMIKEINQSLTDEELLLEDLGTLKKIERKFSIVLKASSKTQIDKRKIKDHERRGEKIEDYNRNVSVPTLSRNIGPESQFTPKSIKNAAEFLSVIGEKDVAGILVKNGNNQVGLFIKTLHKSRGTWGTAVTQYSVGIDFQELNKVNAAFPALITKDSTSVNPGGRSSYRASLMGKIGFTDKPTSVHTVESIDDKQLTKIINAIFAYYKAAKIQMDVEVISMDEGRIKATVAHKERRQGVIPKTTDSDFAAYQKKIKEQFQLRLDKYKSSKAVDVESPVDIIHTIIDKGYLDKIKVAGITYDYHNDYIQFRHLRTGVAQKWDSDRSYITYKVNTNTVEYKKAYKEFEDIFEKYQELRKSRDPAKLTPEEEKEMMSHRVISEIKIYLGMDGGKIVPKDIELDQRW